MKLKLIALFAFFSVTMAQAQHASFEASTGGFSFIPAFTSEDPHLIVNAGTTDTKRLSFHLLSTIRLENFNPRGVIFMSRYKFIDKKLKAIDTIKKSAEVHCSVPEIKLTVCVSTINIEQKPNTKPINFILNLLTYLISFGVSLKLPQKISIELYQ